MARRQFGNLRRLPSGRWQASYWAEGDRHTAPTTFVSKADANAWLSNAEVEIHRGEWVNPQLGQTAFGEWAEQWKGTIVDLRPSTLTRDLDYMRRYILPAFHDRPLGDITNLEIKQWIADLANSDLSPATITKAGQILSKIMRSAVEAGLIRGNPCDNVKLPRIERHEMRYLTATQVAALADAIEPRYRAVVILGAWAGLRAGELFGLKVNKVNLLHRTVEVSEQVVEVAGHLYTGPPKTKAGRRVVPLPKVAVKVLEEHMAQYPSSPYVFTTESGTQVRLASWRQRVWVPAIHKAGVAPFRVHDLRHTAVAQWIAAGASPREIANRAGHSSTSVVLDRYGHLLPGTAEKVNDALDRLAEEGDAIYQDSQEAQEDRARGAHGNETTLTAIAPAPPSNRENEWALRDSNPRPQPCEGCALTS